jgi:short-subunit dehydrogenase
VIGVGPKLGLAVARRFGDGGHSVALVARDPGPLEEYRADFEAHGITCAAISGDMAVEGEAERVVDRARAELGPVEVLVYNAAALGVRGWPSEISVDLLYRTLRVNLVSGMVATQRAVPDMREGGRGTVFFTGGTWGLTPSAEYCAVGLGKAALRNLALSFAEEMAPAGVHVVSFMISGVIADGTDYDPALLAEKYWRVHLQQPDAWERDVLV